MGDQERFDRLRGVELKHGRVAMLACWGYATTWKTGVRFPGREDFPAGHEAVFKIPLQELLIPILAIGGLLELGGWQQKEGSFPGDFSASKFPWALVPTLATNRIRLILDCVN